MEAATRTRNGAKLSGVAGGKYREVQGQESIDERLKLSGLEVHLHARPGRTPWLRVVVRQENDPDWLLRHHGIDISGEEGILKKSEP